jgi:hypothetical protein
MPNRQIGNKLFKEANGTDRVMVAAHETCPGCNGPFESVATNPDAPGIIGHMINEQGHKRIRHPVHATDGCVAHTIWDESLGITSCWGDCGGKSILYYRYPPIIG